MTTEIKDKAEKRKVVLSFLGAKPLTKLSRAYAVFVPSVWYKIYGFELDGRIYVKMEQEGKNLIISPLDKDEALKMMEANDAKPE